MEPAADPEVAEALDHFCAAAERMLAVGLAPVDGVDASWVIRGLEHGARMVRAAQVGLVDEVDRRGLSTCDGHRSAKVMVRHAANLSAPRSSDPDAGRQKSPVRAETEVGASGDGLLGHGDL